MSNRIAWGFGLSTTTDSGKILETWYPHASIGTAKEAEEAQGDFPAYLRPLELKDEARMVSRSVVYTQIDLDEPPRDVPDAYLRLHLLSLRLALPNTINLERMFEVLPTVVWSGSGPCDPDTFDQVRIRSIAKTGIFPGVRSIDKFPRMVDFVSPTGVRIADADRVRLGAYLAPGTTIMQEGFVNYNAGTLGRSMVEGRISYGVTVGDGSDIGGGASIMGTLSSGGSDRISIGKRSLLGANSGIGISLGDDCVVEAGLYITAGTKVTVLRSGGTTVGRGGFLMDPKVVPARRLSGLNNIVFRRNSLSGAVEALPHEGPGAELNEVLHENW